MKPDYLIVGSGISALAFGALMARSGRSVQVLEAHDAPGGYGHTFEVGGYRFNAQLHYVWNCGEGRVVHRFLDRLGLLDEVRFNEYDRGGFDRMRMPGYAVDIPADMELLKERMAGLFPRHAGSISAFLDEVDRTAGELEALPSPLSIPRALTRLHRLTRILKYRASTLQDVFDRFDLPLEAQTLLALQWPDFLLPPARLSFFAWVLLFTGYQKGAYYPQRHFEHVIESLVEVIRASGSEVLLQHKVVDFVVDGGRVTGVLAEEIDGNGASLGPARPFEGREIVCNMDPRTAAEWIGFERFSPPARRKLDYDYSPSSFMAYCVVEDLDLEAHGFGRSNLFHAEDSDLNRCFDRMYRRGDYRQPSFALTNPTLLTDDRSDCPEGQQIVELLTVADYGRFRDLKLASRRAYNAAKIAVFDALCEVVERDYLPEFRDHLCFKMLGSPTTNERYCLAPFGNSYGSNMTPDNIGAGRLDHQSSIPGLHFCNASSGFAGFSGAIWTGSTLYERLSGDRFRR